MDYECKRLKKGRIPKRNEQMRCLIMVAKSVNEESAQLEQLCIYWRIFICQGSHNNMPKTSQIKELELIFTINWRANSLISRSRQGWLSLWALSLAGSGLSSYIFMCSCAWLYFNVQPTHPLSFPPSLFHSFPSSLPSSFFLLFFYYWGLLKRFY